MPIDKLASDIESLGNEEEKKQIIFSKILSNLRGLKNTEKYEELKEYMKIVKRAVYIVKNVIYSQRARFSKNPKLLEQLTKQSEALEALFVYSNAYSTKLKPSDLNETVMGMINAINTFINASEDITSRKNFSLAV